MNEFYLKDSLHYVLHIYNKLTEHEVEWRDLIVVGRLLGSEIDPVLKSGPEKQTQTAAAEKTSNSW